MENKLWINYEQYKKLKEYGAYLERKWWAWTFYGVHPGQYPKFEEFKSSNKQRYISLKDCGKMAKRTGNPTLLSEQKASDSIQDKAMQIPAGATFCITLGDSWNKASEDWNSFCETVKN